MLTKTKPHPNKNYLRLITPRISLSNIEINLDEAKGFLTSGITKKNLNQFKKVASQNIYRSEPIYSNPPVSTV